MTLYATVQHLQETKFIRRADMYRSQPQRLLQGVSLERLSLSCLCRGLPGAPMTVALGANGIHPRRLRGAADRHADGCPHSNVPNLSAALGAAAGAFADCGGQPIVNFDALFRQTSHKSSAGGAWTGSPSADAMLSLAWLLIQRAGLNVFHAMADPGDPFHHVLCAGYEIQATCGPLRMRLDSMLLVPNGDLRANREKLKQALLMGNPLLLATLLPPASSVGNGAIALKSVLGTTSNIWPEMLARARSKYRRASRQWIQGGEVLAIALTNAATVAEGDVEGRTAYARIQRLALMPVTPWLVPLPTDETESQYANALRTASMHVVVPEQDPLLRARATGHPLNDGIC